MERDFFVKVIVSRTDNEGADGMYVPLIIRAASAAGALQILAVRSQATVIGGPSSVGDVGVRARIGVGAKTFPVVISAHEISA